MVDLTRSRTIPRPFTLRTTLYGAVAALRALFLLRRFIVELLQQVSVVSLVQPVKLNTKRRTPILTDTKPTLRQPL